MTTYTTIANTSIDVDSPVTEGLMTALRDNPIAIAEGSSGAPKVAVNALRCVTYTASGTFNVPSDVTKIWYEVAGAGGASGIVWANTAGAILTPSTAGGSSSLGTIATAGGGGAGDSVQRAPALGTVTLNGANGTPTGGDIAIYGRGASGGHSRAYTYDNGADYEINVAGGTGGDGAWVFGQATVTPSSSHTITIGGGGAAGSVSPPTYQYTTGINGSSGWVRIWY